MPRPFLAEITENLKIGRLIYARLVPEVQTVLRDAKLVAVCSLREIRRVAVSSLREIRRDGIFTSGAVFIFTSGFSVIVICFFLTVDMNEIAVYIPPMMTDFTCRFDVLVIWFNGR